MALVLADRVQQTGTANTTVSFTLSGSVTGFQSFTAGVGNGNTTYYAAYDASGNWEVGLGTYSTTGPTLTRTTVYASSNAGAAVTFSGTVNVFVTYPSNRAVYEDASGNASALGTITSGVWQGTVIDLTYGGTGKASAPAAMANLMGFTTTATAAGTTTLDNTSSYYQIFTGSLAQTITLPVTSTLAQGWTFHICNNSTGTLTVNSSGGNLVLTVIPGTTVMYTCILTSGTTAASWEAGYTDFSTLTGTGAVVLADSPTLTGTATVATLSASVIADASVLGRNAGKTANTTITNTTTYTTGGVTLASQTAAANAVWRVRAFGQFTAASSGTARTARIACFWGSTQLTAITTTVLTSTAQTTQFQTEFLLTGSSTTAIWTTGTTISRTASATALAMDNATAASTTVTSGAQTLDLRFSMSTAVAGDSWVVQSVTLERLE